MPIARIRFRWLVVNYSSGRPTRTLQVADGSSRLVWQDVPEIEIDYDTDPDDIFQWEEVELSAA